MLNRIYPQFLQGRAALGVFILRLVIGSAFILHGLFKLQAAPFSWMGPDAPVPGFLQLTAALSEFGGGLLLTLGLLTPLASLMLIGMMIGALGLVHLPLGQPFVSADPSKPSFELPLTYLVGAASILLLGPGAVSVDSLLFSKKEKVK